LDPREVRWIFLSHDAEDHTGALDEALELCSNATLVTTWAATERISRSVDVPPERLRWIDDGESWHIGDRTLVVLRPPVYDSPSTRALFDEATGVLWASEAFATPMPTQPVETVDELPGRLWTEGLAMFHHHAICPWISMVDRGGYADQVRRIRELRPNTIVGAHTPVIAGLSVVAAFDHLAALPDVSPPPHPDRRALAIEVDGHIGQIERQ
jgi:flavorubredoxin